MKRPSVRQVKLLQDVENLPSATFTPKKGLNTDAWSREGLMSLLVTRKRFTVHRNDDRYYASGSDGGWTWGLGMEMNGGSLYEMNGGGLTKIL